MFEYFAVLRVAASSAADPASRAAAATYYYYYGSGNNQQGIQREWESDLNSGMQMGRNLN